MSTLQQWAKVVAMDAAGQLDSVKSAALKELKKRANDFGQNLTTFIEPALTIGTGLVGQAAGGVVGAAGLPFGVDVAANAVKRTQDWMTYVPRTESGQKGMQKLGDAMGSLENKVNTATAIGSGLLTARATGDIEQAANVGKVVKDKGIGTAAGDFVADTTGSPLLATAVSMIPEAVDAVAGTKLAGKIPGKQFEMGDIGSQQFGQRGAVSGLRDANSQLRDLGEGAYIDGDEARGFTLYDNSGYLGKFDSIDEALAAKVNKSTEGDYRITHTAPVREGMNSIDDMTDVYPDDVYDSRVAGQYYGHGGDSVSMDNETARIISGFRGKPDKDITIYRAVPKGITDINKGDWITVNKNYAKSHGDSWVDDGNFDIISKKVKAKDIATDGNSIHEFGYDPNGSK